MTALQELALDMAAMGGISELATPQEKEAITDLALNVITAISKRLSWFSQDEQNAITVEAMIHELAIKYKVR